MNFAMRRFFIAGALLGFSALACAENATGPSQMPTSVPAPSNVQDVTGESDAITERQSAFNVQRQTLKQEADLVEIQARIAEANARIAEAEHRSKPASEGPSLDDIDPTKLRVMLGLPAQGPIVPPASDDKNPEPVRLPAPMDPADTVLPKLTSVTGNVAIFKVMERQISARPGDSINKRYELASIQSQSVTLKRSDGGTRRLMIEWNDRSSEREFSGRTTRISDRGR